MPDWPSTSEDGGSEPELAARPTTPWRSRRHPTSRRGRPARRPPPRRRDPSGTATTPPGLHSRRRPSAISIVSDPATWYWKWGASQRSVPAMCFTWLDQRQPGSRVRRPMSLPATWTISTRPRSNVRVSSGVANVLCSALAMAIDPPTPCAPGGPARQPMVGGPPCHPVAAVVASSRQWGGVKVSAWCRDQQRRPAWTRGRPHRAQTR